MIVCAVPAPGRSQATTEADRIDATLRPPAWALLFQIDRRFTLRSFEGLLVAIERFRSPRSAIRFGIQVRGGTLDQDSAYDLEFADRGGRTDQHGEDENVTTWLMLHYVRTPNPESKLRVYWTCGPQVGYSRFDRQYSYSIAPYDRKASLEDRRTTWSAGIGAALGVRWYPVRSFGLLAEYTASASGIFRSQTSSRRQTGSSAFASSAESDGHAFLFSKDGTNFGLVVRF